MSQPHLINRRYFLQAAGITLALPLLESLSTQVPGATLAVGGQDGNTAAGMLPGLYQPRLFPKIAGKTTLSPY